MKFRSHYFLAPTRSSDDVRAAISDIPGIELDHAYQTKRCYLDTFDRRLQARAYVLEADALKDGCLLILRRLGSETVDWSGEMTGPPGSGDDFDNPGIRTRIKRVTETRALLPRFCFDLNSTVYRSVDADGKTTARVIIEHYPRVFHDSDRHQPVSAIRIHALKGYAQEAGIVAGELNKRLPMEPCDVDISQTIQTMAGIVEPDYTVKPVVRLAPDDGAADAIASVLTGYRNVMLANEHGMENDIDIEFLHDFRVAMRRSRSVFNRTDSGLWKTGQRRFKNDFAWLNRATGKHRDLDVFLLKLQAYERSMDEASTTAMGPLRDLLRKERRGEHAKLLRMLKTKRYRRFRHDWGTMLEEMRGGSTASSAPTVREAANEAIWRMYKRVRARSRSVIDIEHMEPVHELRKDCKQLRYLIEAFQTIYPARPLKRAIGELKALQDALGDICDIYVQIGLLTGWANKLATAHEEDAATQDAVDRLKSTIGKRRRKLFSDMGVQLKRFNGKSNRQLYGQIFRPG